MLHGYYFRKSFRQAMIKVLKQTPAAINGRDCNELLVHEND